MKTAAPDEAGCEEREAGMQKAGQGQSKTREQHKKAKGGAKMRAMVGGAKSRVRKTASKTKVSRRGHKHS